MMVLAIIMCLGLVAGGSVPVPSGATWSMDEAPPRLYTVQPRRHKHLHTVSVGVGLLPGDAFYRAFALLGSYTYQLTPSLTWEVVQGVGALSAETGTAAEVAKFGLSAADFGSKDRPRFVFTSNALWQPLSGKAALLNRWSFDLDTHLAAGVGAMSTTSSTIPVVHAGLRLRAWLSEHAAVECSFTDYVSLKDGSSHNVLWALTLSLDDRLTAQMDSHARPPHVH